MKSLETTAIQLEIALNNILKACEIWGSLGVRLDKEYYRFEFDINDAHTFTIGVNGKGNDTLAYLPEMLREVATHLEYKAKRERSQSEVPSEPQASKQASPKAHLKIGEEDE